MEKASKGDKRRAQMIFEATELFSKHGFDQASLQMVAAKCDVTHAAVAYHFKTKQGLLASVAEAALENCRELIEATYAKEDSAHEKLIKYFEGHLTWIMVYRSQAEVFLLFCYYCSVNPEFSDTFIHIASAQREHIQGLLMAGVREQSFKVPDTVLAAKLLHDGLIGMVTNALSGRAQATGLDELQTKIASMIRHLAIAAP